MAAVDLLVPRSGARAADPRAEAGDAQIAILVARAVDPGVARGVGDHLGVLVADGRDRGVGRAVVGARVARLAVPPHGVVRNHRVQHGAVRRLGVIAAVAAHAAAQRAARVL